MVWGDHDLSIDQQPWLWFSLQLRTDFIFYFSRFHSISRSYFRKANGILLLYDITSEKSFLNITQWLEQIEVNKNYFAYLFITSQSCSKQAHKIRTWSFTVDCWWIVNTEILICLLGILESWHVQCKSQQTLRQGPVFASKTWKCVLSS